MFNEREASSRSACWFQRGRSVVVQRRAPGALREFVTGSWRPERPSRRREAALGAVRRAMRRCLRRCKNDAGAGAPGSDTDYTERVAASKPTLFWGSLSQDPLSAAPARRRGRRPCAAQRRLRRGRAAWLGGVARARPRSTSVYAGHLHQPPSPARRRHRPPTSRVDVAPTGGPGPPRGRPASPPTTAGPHRRGGRLLPSGLPTVTRSSGPSLPRTYTVRTAR